MTVTAPSVRLLGDQLWTLLGGTAGQVFTAGAPNLFRGRVEAPPTLPESGGVVAGYAVLYETPGRRYGTRAGSVRDRVDGLFQVTCVGGDTVTCLWVVDKVTTILTGAAMVPPGRSKPTMRLFEDESNTVRSVIEDRDVSPYRYYVPLLFRLRA